MRRGQAARARAAARRHPAGMRSSPTIWRSSCSSRSSVASASIVTAGCCAGSTTMRSPAAMWPVQLTRSHLFVAGAVHVRVGLHRLHQLRDPRRRGADVVRQARGIDQRLDPAHGAGHGAGGTRWPTTSRSAFGDAGIDQRAGQRPRVGYAALVEPLADRVFATAAAERVERWAPGAGATTRPARPAPAATRRRDRPRRDPPPGRPGRSAASRSASASRRTAAAGLFSSCASPAASVPSAVIFSRCWISARGLAHAVGHRRDTSRWPSTGMRCSISANVPWESAERAAASPPRGRRQCTSRMRENGSRPVTSPAYCTKVGTSCPPTPISSSMRALEDHEHAVGGIARREDHLAGLELQHLAVAGQPLELIVGQARRTPRRRRSSLASGLLTASPRRR